MSEMKRSKYSFAKREKKHFLELAFESKMKSMQEQPQQGVSAGMHTIGSIHNKKTNYDVDECFFAKDDIPIQVRDIHNNVREFIDPDFLGMRKKEWNSSVSIPMNQAIEQDHQRKLLNIRIGQENHPILKQKDKYIEPGCDTRFDYTGWDVSTAIDPREVRSEFNNLNERSGITCSNYRTRYIGQDYTNPEAKVAKINDVLRAEKLINEDKLQNLRETYKFTNPEISKEKCEGAVYRLNYEKTLKGRQKEYYTKLKEEEERERNMMSKEIGRTKCIADEIGDEEEDYSKKIDLIMRSITESKRNRDKNRKLNWIYEGI